MPSSPVPLILSIVPGRSDFDMAVRRGEVFREIGAGQHVPFCQCMVFAFPKDLAYKIIDIVRPRFSGKAASSSFFTCYVKEF